MMLGTTNIKFVPWQSQTLLLRHICTNSKIMAGKGKESWMKNRQSVSESESSYTHWSESNAASTHWCQSEILGTPCLESETSRPHWSGWNWKCAFSEPIDHSLMDHTWFLKVNYFISGSRGSVLDDPCSSPDSGQIFRQNIEANSVAHPASYYMATVCSFLRGVAIVAWSWPRNLVPRIRMSRAIPPLPLHVFLGYVGKPSPLYFFITKVQFWTRTNVTSVLSFIAAKFNLVSSECLQLLYNVYCFTAAAGARIRKAAFRTH